MKISKFPCAIFLIFFIFSYQVQDTDATAIIIAKAIIAAKIIKGLAIAGWFTRGGFGSFGGGGGGGGLGGGLGGGTGGFLWGKRKRDIKNGFNVTNEDVEQLFSIVSNIDEDLCMARIICEIHASKDRKEFGELGDGIQGILKNYNVTVEHAKSPVVPYKQAAILGSVSENNVCADVYSICRLRPEQIESVIDTANNVDW